jgi:hypothetical protein
MLSLVNVSVLSFFMAFHRDTIPQIDIRPHHEFGVGILVSTKNWLLSGQSVNLCLFILISIFFLLVGTHYYPRMIPTICNEGFIPQVSYSI